MRFGPAAVLVLVEAEHAIERLKVLGRVEQTLGKEAARQSSVVAADIGRDLERNVFANFEDTLGVEFFLIGFRPD